uniref:Transposase (Putative), gypsy type n=1 Tax=Tanacetum cinerariifolium TaxID=118510 RepID=A0A699HB12_TANCI|nr:transposase (putative), gypsy type [Tanacetum cinerariifolium]
MSEGLKYGVEHGKANLDLEAIEAYDPEADTKYVAALHALRDLKYPMVDQLESLKDAPIDVIMASLHLESDTRDDASQWIRELRPSSSRKKKKYRVVCRTHGVGSAHHARSDGVPVSVPTVAPQGLVILLADAATQTETSEDGASPRICIGSVSCAPWESSRMHLTS